MECLVTAPAASPAILASHSATVQRIPTVDAPTTARRPDEIVRWPKPECALIAVICAMLLGACGGGNDNTSTQAGSVPLQAAVANEVNNGYTANFSVSGTINSVPVTGSGTLTDSAPVTTTFNGATARGTTETITDTVTENGTPVSVTETKQIFTDPGTSAEVGQINDDGSIDVITQPDPIPVSVAPGNSGTLGTGTEFSDTSEQDVTGTVDNTYTVESGTANNGGSGTTNCNGDVVDFVKKVTDKNNGQIRKSERKMCVDDKGNSKFVSGDEQESNKGQDDDFNENNNQD